MTDDYEHAKMQQRVEDLRREYCPEEHPEAAERQARREARERVEASEPWKDEASWWGPEPGRCGSCGQFVGGGAIICADCDVNERRRDFEGMLP